MMCILYFLRLCNLCRGVGCMQYKFNHWYFHMFQMDSYQLKNNCYYRGTKELFYYMINNLKQ